MSASDADRFTRLYRENFPRVLGYAMRRATLDAAREATAEAFLVAWRRLDDVPDPALPWLLVVTRNVIADQRRGGRRADALHAEVERLTGAAVHPDPSEDVVERSVVLQAVAALPETDREALVLTVWDGLGHRAAAKVAGCSVGAFAVRLHRARRRLRTELDRLDDAGVPEAPAARMEAG
ncbi:RNA polymerase sigma factor [Pseudonocardia lacus]|uniref:RNA polymerase sigma factor n=1 Tax=Pseudonocardia lacus TaxID=2835865 RepID=UPI001BDC9195|nr:sigma-70 family RNA polymerase sigma factor [Pseudonocardia lacus]